MFGRGVVHGTFKKWARKVEAVSQEAKPQVLKLFGYGGVDVQTNGAKSYWPAMLPRE